MSDRNRPISIVPDSKYPNMHRLQWADGVLSQDMYNLTRAKDILRNYDKYTDNMVKADRLKTYRFSARKSAAGEFSGGASVSGAERPL
jgi:hypothetical protein